MAKYVISDIHGNFDMFIELIEKINFSESDELYILGDVVDREPHACKTLLWLMAHDNIFPIIGNHELMALPCLRFLIKEISEENIKLIDDKMVKKLLIWQLNGGTATIGEFHKLTNEKQQAIIDYLGEFSAFEEVETGGNTYLLIHGGLDNYEPGKKIEDYTLQDIVWSRADYDIRYFPDKFVVTGHTPTQYIEDNPHPGYIFHKNGHIAIDCGCNKRNGRLAALCLDTGEEFYSSGNNESDLE